MEEETVLSRETYQKFLEKLEYYKTHRRREVAERIRQAKEFGEVGENLEYEDAKREQAFIEGEIMNLENILKHARILDKGEIHTDIVSMGSRVKLKNMDTGEEVEYKIVGSSEADPFEGHISNLSPVGSQLCNKKKGDIVEIKVPAGKVKYKIIKILREER